MPKAAVNGIEVYYEVHGEGPDMVFAHGMGGSHLIWWQQIPVLSQSYRCIIFDHRGWGQSTEVPDGPGYRAFVEDLRCLLDHLGVGRTFLVAQSMGGLTCLGFAATYPDRTRGLVLGGTTGAMGDESVLVPLREYWARTDRPEGPIGPTSRKNDPARSFLYKEMNALNPPRQRPEEPLDAFRNGEGPTAEDLARMGVPTLLIVGTEDHLVSPAIMERVQKLIPGSSLEVVPQAGHSVYFERPEIFNRLVSRFLAETMSREGAKASPI